MKDLTKFFLVTLLWSSIVCKPYDDGRYKPKKNKMFDDGKYYRPLDEGRYIPGDEGRYTYIYRQGLYPGDDGDYRYIHQLGPDGGFGGNGGEGGFGGNGGEGGFGGNGNDGRDSDRKPNIIEYIGRKIYAERYPYIHKVIKALVDEYVSEDILASEGSANFYRKAFGDKEIAAKCRYLTPEHNNTEFVTQYPPRLELKEGENRGSFYTFKGTKVLSKVANALTTNLRLEYEVIVRVVEEVTD